MEVKLTIIVLVAVALMLDNPAVADYLWHNDEIPYNSKAKCYRGHSYYSNSFSANDTDIDIASDIDSLLGYDNDYSCYFCVCSVDGSAAGCIHRDVHFCNFFKVIRDEKAQRDSYTTLLQQDRPTYFRQLSWRLRRTMDTGMFDLLKNVGDALPENSKCVPFVSEYSNCDDDNSCTGCTKCTCSGQGQWVCNDVKECGITVKSDESQQIKDEDDVFDNALNMLQFEMGQSNLYKMKHSKNPNVPGPNAMKERNLRLDIVKDYRMDEIVTSLMRPRRSVGMKTNKHSKRSTEKKSTHSNTSTNDTIQFYETVDELNEDTLKESNVSGTLLVRKMDLIPQLAMRRSGDAGNSSKSLQIEYNQPKAYNQITDNKIDVSELENKFDASHENLKSVLGNQTQKAKDKDLSKIVVNELKKGSEVIGDADAPVTSNITFTPENDTLTAMAFIAGNLLNKLWNMEKDASGSSMEKDVMKQEKITDLLDLFKEPLNLRQESFLKSALEQLSNAIDKNKDVRNISLCADIEEAKKLLYDKNSTSEENKSKDIKSPCEKDITNVDENKKKQATVKAISKINHVLELIRKFEGIQTIISDLKHGPRLDLNLNHTTPTSRKLNIMNDTILTKDEKYSLNVFGNVLEKLTKLLLPNRNNKKISNHIKHQNILSANDDNLKDKFKKIYNIDLTNMTVTAKDKLVLDYLTHIDGNPNCLLNNNKQKNAQSLPSIEGNILLNLSEFFKMKSFGDLVKLLEQENHQTFRSPTKTAEQTDQVVEATTTLGVKKTSTNFQHVDSKKFNSTKEKLKAHLKTIIEDLIELQNSKGISVKGNIKISDALPCIYNILNTGTDQVETKKVADNDSTKNIVNIFKEIKKEAKALEQAMNPRRINSISTMKERPKSATIWERIIKNLNEKANSKSRRMLDDKAPKCYNEIKEMMDKLETSSSTYKHVALKIGVPVAGKLILLKALDLDVKSAINVLEEIKLAYEHLQKLPSNKFTELAEFVANVATRINLTDKVNEKVKLEPRKYFLDEINTSNKELKTKLKRKPIVRYSEIQDSDDLKVSRDQVVNQLIRNRVQLYLNLKGDAEYDVRNDENYNIAKGVLYYLDSGNNNVARELFKMFVSQKKDNLAIPLNNDSTNDKFIATSTPKFSEVLMRRMGTHQKEPLLQFQESTIQKKPINWVNQDHLIKQLLNIKNMGM